MAFWPYVMTRVRRRSWRSSITKWAARISLQYFDLKPPMASIPSIYKGHILSSHTIYDVTNYFRWEVIAKKTVESAGSYGFVWNFSTTVCARITKFCTLFGDNRQHKPTGLDTASCFWSAFIIMSTALELGDGFLYIFSLSDVQGKGRGLQEKIQEGHRISRTSRDGHEIIRKLLFRKTNTKVIIVTMLLSYMRILLIKIFLFCLTVEICIICLVFPFFFSDSVFAFLCTIYFRVSVYFRSCLCCMRFHSE